MPQPSFLPSDEVIFERCKTWSSFLSRVVKEEKYDEIYFDEIPSGEEDNDESESEENENKPVNALVKASHFEASSSGSEFDVDDLLNETLPVVAERTRKWKESGMDKVLDTFDFNAITDKVGAWLRKASMEKSMAPNSSLEDAQIMHFENHQIQFNSDDSLQSADTAKYILSNRKPRAASCTTMTIKRFRYVKGKQKELQRKYGYDVHQDLNEVFNRRCAGCRTTSKSRTVTRSKSEVPVRPPSIRNATYKERLDDSLPRVVVNPKQEALQRLKSRHRKRRSDISRKRSISSSSTSSSGSNCSNSHTRPKFRRVFRKSKKKDSLPFVDLTILTNTSTDCELSAKQTLSPMRTSNQNAAPSKPTANVNQVKTAYNSNATCFLSERLVNSTALSNTKTDKRTKMCQLSPIAITKENEKTENKQKETSSTHLNQGSDRKVIVYSPQDRTLHGDSIRNGSFRLTEEHLRKTIGEKAARTFIRFNEQKFPWEFDSTSTVYFKLPTESNNSHQSGSNDDSDEDVLNMFGKFGELVEQASVEL